MTTMEGRHPGAPKLRWALHDKILRNSDWAGTYTAWLRFDAPRSEILLRLVIILYQRQRHFVSCFFLPAGYQPGYKA
jgi:hypothetical protein